MSERAPKLAVHPLRHKFHEVLRAIQPVGNGLEVFAFNEVTLRQPLSNLDDLNSSNVWATFGQSKSAIAQCFEELPSARVVGFARHSAAFSGLAQASYRSTSHLWARSR